MSRRDLLTAEDRRTLFGLPKTRDALARRYLLDVADMDLVVSRRGPGNRLGFAVQLLLLRHPGLPLAQAMTVPWIDLEPLVAFVAEQLRLSPDGFPVYCRQAETLARHSQVAARALGLRPPGKPDIPTMVEAAAAAAWATDKGPAIAAAVIDALRRSGVILPSPAVVERTGVTGRALARKRIHAALLSGLSADRLEAIDALSVVNSATGLTRLTELRTIPTVPKPDHVRDILDKLSAVRAFGVPPDAGSRIHPDRLSQLAREGRLTPPYLLDRYTTARRRATLVALALDLEARLTDAALDMADRLVGGAFTRAKNAQARAYTMTARDVGRLMRLFQGTIDALAVAVKTGADALASVEEGVGVARLMAVRPEVASIAETADADPLVRAADRHASLRKFAPARLTRRWRRSGCCVT